MIYFIGYMLIGLAVTAYACSDIKSELMEFCHACGIDNNQDISIIVRMATAVVAMAWPITVLMAIYLHYR